VRNFLSNMIIARAADTATFRRERVFVAKLDAVLVQVLKQDWPHAWPGFIPDLCAASRSSEALCENSMLILKVGRMEEGCVGCGWGGRGELRPIRASDLTRSFSPP